MDEKKEIELDEQNKNAEPHGISINIASEQDDDNDEYVSPNKEIFQKVSNDISGAGSLFLWHGGNKEKTGDFELDEMYSRTSQNDRKFNEAFGQSGFHQISDKQSDEDQNDDDQVNFEYNDRLQRKEIIGMYKYAKSSLKTKLILSSIFAIIIFFVENISLLFPNASTVWEYFDIYKHPYIHIIISLSALIICSIFAYEQLYHGIKSIFKRSFIPESVVGIALGVALINNLLQIISVSVFKQPPALYNFPVAIIVLSSILFSYINVARERFGFGVVSSKDSKFFLEKVFESEAEAEYDTFTSTSNGEFKGEIARVGRTSFIKNYFANTNAPVNLKGFLKFYYFFVIVISLVFAIVAMFKDYNLADSLTYFSISALLLLPVGTLFAYSIPFYFGNKSLYDSEVSIIGENAIDDFSKMDVVAVNDTSAFPPSNVKLTYFNVYNNFTMEDVIYYAASGFSVVGGPLAEVFDAATNNAVMKSKQVKFTCAGRSYLCVSVDGHNIIFADKFGMTAQGIEVGTERDDIEDVSVMYTACDGELCAKMYIKYQIDEEFVKTAINANKNGLIIGIRTFDPNISNDLMAKITDFDKHDVRIIKLSSTKEVPTHTSKKDARIVSKGRSSALLKAIPVCKRIATIRKVIKALKIVASVLGGAYIGLCIFGVMGLLPSVSIVLYYLAFFAIMLLLTVVMLPKKG
ncbi:MAG: hypothetical protein IJ400_00905 [Clostridia bacterium]|nr:hypothetical protein [Clostridia bacterium]